MKECPRHRGMDTMVPCMRCGRYFCRICNPPRGATHYCPQCQEEIVRDLERKSRKKTAARPSAGKYSQQPAGKVKRRVSDLGSRLKPRAEPRKDDRKRPPVVERRPGPVGRPKPLERPAPTARKAERGVPGPSVAAGKRAGGKTPAVPLESAGTLPVPSRATGTVAPVKPRRVSSAFSSAGRRIRAIPTGLGQWISSLRSRFGLRAIEEKVEEHSDQRERERAERRAAKREERRAKRRERRESLEWRRDKVSRSASGAAARAWEGFWSGFLAVAGFIPRKVASFASAAYYAFPLGLSEKETAEDYFPPLREKWKSLVLIILCGIAIWVFSVFLVRGRWAVWGAIVAVWISAAFVWSFDGFFSKATGLCAAAAAVVAILLGELVVQLLYRLHILKNVGITEEVTARTASTMSFMVDYLGWFVIGILVPAAVIAFLIGVWPLPKRIYWRGTGS